MLTQEDLKAILNYDSNSGLFTWKVRRKRIKIGAFAGCKRKNGYIYIGINGKVYLAHRLAWLYHHGYFPENMIDHINRNTTDNRICNLREVSTQCNSRNCKIQSRNISGITGVSWNKNRNKWKAYITVNYKLYHLGYFEHFDEAVCYRLVAEQCLNWAGCSSSSPAYQYVKENINKDAK